MAQISADRVELMQMQDRFLLKRIGLTLAPDFSVPLPDPWNNFDGEVPVVSPNGEQKEFQAKFEIWHFKFASPGVDISRCWRIVISLPQASKEDVPIGGKVWATPDIKRVLGAPNS